jgi:hypothetical protein
MNNSAHLGYIRYIGNSLERGVNKWPKKLDSQNTLKLMGKIRNEVRIVE